ncbi:MAG: 2Fe-2S iron-sulfur cluster binding domain-containing protein [Chloroflexi bacterium]|nr:2Fe-2S iron-sulfur cluster binding domain-containing protein [Chloroflexota bacterium]
MINLTINGESITAPEGATILEVARMAGIEIPTLCHHPDLSNVGACRMCVVSVQGARALQTACTTPAADGMVVDTMSEDAVETRKFVLEMLLTDHPNECMTCEVNGDCELQDLVYDYGVKWPEHNGQRHQWEINPDPNPFIFIDRNKCILCSRCIRACNEIQNRDVWNFAYRGFQTKLVAGADQFMLDAGCESCGQCVAYCPVGALYDKMSIGLGRVNQITKVRTTCSYCGVGCNFDLNVRDGRIIRVTSAADAPVNGMALCVKGRYGYDYVHHPDRLTRPLVRAKWLGREAVEERIAAGEWAIFDEAKQRLTHRRPPNDAQTPIPNTQYPNTQYPNTQDLNTQLPPDTFIATDWDTALDVVANKFAETKKKFGGDAFALLASAKCTNEENFIFNKFTRQMLATHSIDHCARL